MRNNDNKGMEENVPVAMQLITGIWRVSKMGHLIVPVGLVLLFLFFFFNLLFGAIYKHVGWVTILGFCLATLHF